MRLTKICSKCKIEKELIDFYPRPDRKIGVYPSCRSCKCSHRSRKYKREKENNPISLWIHKNFLGVKSRAKCNNIDFELTEDNLKNFLISQNYKCIYCESDFDFNGTRTNKMKSPTVDRILPQYGYVSKNMVLCCYRCNSIKMDATYIELRKMSYVLESLLNSTN